MITRKIQELGSRKAPSFFLSEHGARALELYIEARDEDTG